MQNSKKTSIIIKLMIFIKGLKINKSSTKLKTKLFFKLSLLWLTLLLSKMMCWTLKRRYRKIRLVQIRSQAIWKPLLSKSSGNSTKKTSLIQKMDGRKHMKWVKNKVRACHRSCTIDQSRRAVHFWCLTLSLRWKMSNLNNSKIWWRIWMKWSNKAPL